MRRFSPKPGSGRGHTALEFVQPLLLMLDTGRRSLEDVRLLQSDRGATRACPLGVARLDGLGGTWSIAFRLLPYQILVPHLTQNRTPGSSGA